MSAAHLLATLRARGAVISIRGAKLRVDAPPGVLDAAMKALLVVYKSELVRLVDELDDSRALAQQLISATFERIAGWWIAGAELPSAELEADIDRAALAGDLSALGAALSLYEQTAHERCERHRAALRGDAEA